MSSYILHFILVNIICLYMVIYFKISSTKCQKPIYTAKSYQNVPKPVNIINSKRENDVV